ncbi:hypothetical protein [Rhizobium mongolense]|uniref:Uncharacterized protein n=1 Tax=Rhizobium mongolense TaxID=57676 RepID=A0A7W6RR84_9HYPH|nr:hypothetical protein [Rhizobium mongolense]MBB4277094.1 hypothetical protein [Rhizobium mongolense]
MRTALFTLVRLGPALAYATAAVFLTSILLLEYSPASASAWWLYMTLLPVMREPIYLLFAVPGAGIWIATVLLTIVSLVGIRLALQPQRYLRAGFIHAHVALIATGLTMGRAAVAQAGLSSFSLPQLLWGDWSFLPLSYSPLATFLFVLVLSACICCHLRILERYRSGEE